MIWVWAVTANIITGVSARALGWVSPRGMSVGIVAGSAIYVGMGGAGWSLLLGFFVLGSCATRFRFDVKERLGTAQEKRGARGVREALANCGLPLLLALIHAFYPEPYLRLAFAGALATALADTTASELGPVWGKRTFLPISLRRVPAGTEGAISIEGTVAGIAAAALLGTLGWMTQFLGAEGIVAVTAGAAIASYIESILGAGGQRSWAHRLRLDNEALNFTNTLLGGALACVVHSLLLR